jgi:hypothetical protein
LWTTRFFGVITPTRHKGFCIGYGLARIPKPKLDKVVYGGSRSVKTSLIAKALLENDCEAQDLLDRDILLRKAASWIAARLYSSGRQKDDYDQQIEAEASTGFPSTKELDCIRVCCLTENIME